MHLLYEEDGELRIATPLSSSGSGESQTWQANALSGKHLKLKSKDVWLQFDHADPSALLEEAKQIAKTIDLQLLWDCVPDEEFLFSTIAQEYFGDRVGSAQLVGLAIALAYVPADRADLGTGAALPRPSKGG